MPDPNALYEKLIELLDHNQVDYKLFSHREALTVEEASNFNQAT